MKDRLKFLIYAGLLAAGVYEYHGYNALERSARIIEYYSHAQSAPPVVGEYRSRGFYVHEQPVYAKSPRYYRAHGSLLQEGDKLYLDTSGEKQRPKKQFPNFRILE